MLSETPRTDAGHEEWVADLRVTETAVRESETGELADDRSPLHPIRSTPNSHPCSTATDHRRRRRHFGSYAGRVIDSYVPGAWLDSGPFGCLGSGPGYALAAKLARPDRQVVLLQGDGAFGFSGMEWDTLVRHNVPVVSVIGNNGIWGLEKHPMEAIYGYSVVAELRPGTRYDEVVRASVGTASWFRRPPSSGRRWHAPWAEACPPSSTCSPTPRWPIRAARTWPDIAAGM